MHSILHGDCLALLPTLADNSIDAIVTDPPYCLTHPASRQGDGAYGRISGGFMNAKWDDDIAFRPDVWRECLRVLKPGGHIAVFGGSRTHHRVWVAVEDAGFEIRDTLMWLYGSGFPKSRNVSKAIDVELGAARYQTGRGKAADGTYVSTPGRDGAASGGYNGGYGDIDHAPPATPQAEQWQGYGTALKPSHEPILLARKPLIGTVAQNVLKHGTGGINVDACRVHAGSPPMGWDSPRGGIWTTDSYATGKLVPNNAGRWPPNLLHDGSEEVVGCFPSLHGSGNKKDINTGTDATYDASSYHVSYAGRANRDYGGASGSAARFFPALGYTDDELKASGRWPPNLLLDGSDEVVECFLQSTPAGSRASRNTADGMFGLGHDGQANIWHNDEGSASRFFPALGYTDDERRVLYCPKASRKDRNGSKHPTVKPIKLIEWLCTLICPPNGTILDPFAGSGTTGQAAINLGFDVIMIERETEYYNDILKRVSWPPLPADAP